MEWIDTGEGNLDRLVALRDDITRGDNRALYLMWLKIAPWEVEWQQDDLDDPNFDILEPPVPPNLQNLTPALRYLITFFDIDPDLVAVAAQASTSVQQASDDLTGQIPKLPEDERNALLARVLQGDPHVGMELKQRLRDLLPEKESSASTSDDRRSIGALLAAAKEHTKQRKAKEKRQREQARIRELENLIPRQEALWDEVDRLIAEQKARPYDEATKILVDLRDLAQHQGTSEQFNTRMRQVRATVSPTSALHKRFDRAGLPK